MNRNRLLNKIIKPAVFVLCLMPLFCSGLERYYRQSER